MDNDTIQMEADSLEISHDDLDVPSDFDNLKKSIEFRKSQPKDSTIMKSTEQFKPKIVKRAEVVEDFIRNFFTDFRLKRTLEEFNKEFIELRKKGKFNDLSLGQITDAHIKNTKLKEKLERMSVELDQANRHAEDAKYFNKQVQMGVFKEREGVSPRKLSRYCGREERDDVGKKQA